MKELLQSRPPKDLGGENSDNRATITLADMHPDGNEIAGFQAISDCEGFPRPIGIGN